MYIETNRAVKFESKLRSASKTRVRFTRRLDSLAVTYTMSSFEIKRRFTSGVLHQIHFYRIINPVSAQNEIIGIKNLSCSRKREREPSQNSPSVVTSYHETADKSLVKDFFSHFIHRVTLKSQEIVGSAIFKQPRLKSQILRGACSEI